MTLQDYPTETLELALQAGYTAQRDPSRICDAAWHNELSRNLRLIEAELERRETQA